MLSLPSSTDSWCIAYYIVRIKNIFQPRTWILKEMPCGYADFAKNQTKINPFTLSHPILSIVSRKMVPFRSNSASTKIVPPIILFLIDISGSMTSSIYADILTKSQLEKGKSSSLITTQMKKIIEDSIMRKNEAQYLT